MRLIDADQFKKEIEYFAEDRKFNKRDLHFSTNDLISNIDSQPEVDAIPIKYIYSKIILSPNCDRKSCETLYKLINTFREDSKDGRGL